MKIDGLRSGYVKVGGMFHFARMCDKIRLHAAGKLPEDYHELLGKGFDGRVVKFFRVPYEEVRELVIAGLSDEKVFAWGQANGRKLSAEDILIFNCFMSKRGWRDDQEFGHNERVRKEYGLAGRTDIQTDFDLIEADECRPLDAWKDAWKPQA